MIDLLMWTLNGESTLPYCLHSIEKAVPEDVVGQKIVVDGGSVDKTKEICMLYGWTVVDAEKRGIPFQANQALRLVETKFFACFEQDIVLHSCWFKYIMKHFDEENIVAAQGVRVAVNPVLRAIDVYKLNHQPGYSSLDNNIFRTDIMRELGGFNAKFLLGLDRETQARVRASGKKWVIDKRIISTHLHYSLRKELSHQFKTAWLSGGWGSKFMNVKRFLYSPVRGFDIAVKQKRPEPIFYYPLLRLAKLCGVLCH